MVAALVAGALLGAPGAAHALEPGDLVVSDYGDFNGGGSVVMGVDPATGTRELVSSNAAPAGEPALAGSNQLALEASGDAVVAQTAGKSVLRVDLATGARSVVSSASVGSGPALTGPTGVLVLPDGGLLVTDYAADALFRIDPATGDRTVVSGAGVGSGQAFSYPTQSVLDGAGGVYVADAFLPAVLHVDLATGTRTTVSGLGVGTGPAMQLPLIIDRESSGAILLAEQSFFGGNLYRIDPATGDRTVLSSPSVGTGPGTFKNIGDIEVEADGSILLLEMDGFGLVDGSILRVDPVTGNRTLVSHNLVGADPYFISPDGLAIVPEAPPQGQYPEQVLAAGPAGYWRFGEEGGTTAVDSSGNGNDGTYFGGALLGQLGTLPDDTAATFDGVNDHVRVPDDPTLDVAASFTAEGWIKRTTTTRTHALFNKGGNGLHLVVMNAGAGSQIFLRRANGTTIARSTGGIPADGAFHHVAATMNGAGTARIYLDGTEDTVHVAPTAAIADTTFPLTFASTATTATTLDELALYDDPLAPEQIAAHHAAGAGQAG